MIEIGEHECVNCGDPCDCGYDELECEWCDVCQYQTDRDDEDEYEE